MGGTHNTCGKDQKFVYDISEQTGRRVEALFFLELFTIVIYIYIHFYFTFVIIIIIKLNCGAVQHCSRAGLLYSDPQRSSFILL
jgi:hypothetical protein